MALSSTIRTFTVELADVDRGVYETLDLRVAQHPSETVDRLTVRVLARCLAHEENLEFGRGLSEVEDPALWSTDATGEVMLWVDVGAPSAERVHRASKRSARVMVVTHKSIVGLRKEWSSRSIHQAESIEVVLLRPDFIDELAAQITRKNHWVLTITEGYVSLGIGDETLETQLERKTVEDLVG